MILGITGGSGSGKTTLLEIIRSKGGLVLDCDAIYHQLLKTDPALLKAIGERFPGTVEQGALDRKKLGTIVFADEASLLDLNRITHRAVKAEVIRRIESVHPVQGSDTSSEEEPPLIAIDAFALFEGGLAELCKLTVAVIAPEENRIQRLMERDGISESYARSRIAAQKSNADFSALCDYTIENNGSIKDFQTKCLAFFRDIGIM